MAAIEGRAEISDGARYREEVTKRWRRGMRLEEEVAEEGVGGQRQLVFLGILRGGESGGGGAGINMRIRTGQPALRRSIC